MCPDHYNKPRIRRLREQINSCKAIQAIEYLKLQLLNCGFDDAAVDLKE